MKRQGVLGLGLLLAVGCASFDSAAVRERGTQIEQKYSVRLDISKTSPLRGDTMRTLRRIEKALVIPWLYGSGDAKRTDAAWKRFERIRKSDPVAGRKVELILRYIALHEEPSDLNTRWQRTFGPLGRPEPAKVAVSR